MSPLNTGALFDAKILLVISRFASPSAPRPRKADTSARRERKALKLC